jgi:hypothetical protein
MNGIFQSASRSRKSTEKLKSAFEHDGYKVFEPVVYTPDKKCRGIYAEHKTAKNYETRKPKKAYYVEGTPFQMGYLVGVMAPKDVERMTEEFMEKIIPDFVAPGLPDEIGKPLGDFLGKIGTNFTYKRHLENRRDIPKALREEMQGIVMGCRKADPNTKVTFKKLLCLNAGIDAILSILYPGKGWLEALEDMLSLKIDREFSAVEITALKAFEAAAKALVRGLDPAHFRVPIMCNAMSVFGDATADGKHYFGRDFMFPSAGVYQDTACMIIYNPAYKYFWNWLRKPLPFVAVTAPGLVGCPTAMNVNGVGFGVDMSPGGNCNPYRPGMNSLLMGRHCIQRAKNADKAVESIINSQRGVTWIYFVADGSNDRAVAVEAGMTAGQLDYFEYPPNDLREKLPTQEVLQNVKHGVIARWDDFKYDEAFLKYNDRLFTHFFKHFNMRNFQGATYINKNWKGRNVPEAYYFAPKRGGKPGVIIATNHFITPEMRLCAMHDWTVKIEREENYNDIQWRYDELNRQVMDAYGGITFDKALEIIDFLAPYPKTRPNPEYYASKNKKKSSDGKSYVIDGSVSICNLTDRVIKSHFGYYHDDWVQITLRNYVGEI